MKQFEAIEAFSKELAKYKTGMGTIQFPLDKSLPLTLVTKVVKYRVTEIDAKQKAKQKKPVTKSARKATLSGSEKTEL